MTAATISVEVAYALPDQQVLVCLELPDTATIQDAITASGLPQRFPEIGNTPTVGLFSKLTTLTSRLRANDRVEIYRPLLADPKEIRRRRAAERAKK